MLIFGYPASTLLSLVNEIRIWAAAVAAIAAVITGLSGYAQIRLQSLVSKEKDQAYSEFKLASENRISAAQNEAAAANERAARLTLEAERIRKEIAWRTLTTDQARILIENLHGHEFEIWVTTTKSDPEAMNYYEQILECFTRAGLKPNTFIGYERAYGVAVSTTAAPGLDIVHNAFEKAGIPLSPKQGDAIGKGALEITVGSKLPTF